MLAAEAGDNLKIAGSSDSDGMVLNKDVLFGEYADAYEVLINQYISEIGIKLPMQQVISSLIDAGIHKMGHVRNLSDVVNLHAIGTESSFSD